MRISSSMEFVTQILLSTPSYSFSSTSSSYSPPALPPALLPSLPPLPPILLKSISGPGTPLYQTKIIDEKMMEITTCIFLSRVFCRGMQIASCLLIPSRSSSPLFPISLPILTSLLPPPPPSRPPSPPPPPPRAHPPFHFSFILFSSSFFLII